MEVCVYTQSKREREERERSRMGKTVKGPDFEGKNSYFGDLDRVYTAESHTLTAFN